MTTSNATQALIARTLRKALRDQHRLEGDIEGHEDQLQQMRRDEKDLIDQIKGLRSDLDPKLYDTSGKPVE